MDKAFWTAREEAAVALAHGAVSEHARSIHLELARRYAAEAARCDRPAATPTIEGTCRHTATDNPAAASHGPDTIFQLFGPGRPAGAEPES